MGSNHQVPDIVDSSYLHNHSSSLILLACKFCAVNLHVGQVHGVTSTGLVGEAVRVFQEHEWGVHHLLTSTDKLSCTYSIQHLDILS